MLPIGYCGDILNAGEPDRCRRMALVSAPGGPKQQNIGAPLKPAVAEGIPVVIPSHRRVPAEIVVDEAAARHGVAHLSPALANSSSKPLR